MAEHVVQRRDAGPDQLGAAEKRSHAGHFPRHMWHDGHEQPRSPHPDRKVFRHPRDQRLGHVRVRVDQARNYYSIIIAHDRRARIFAAQLRE